MCKSKALLQLFYSKPAHATPIGGGGGKGGRSLTGSRSPLWAFDHKGLPNPGGEFDILVKYEDFE